MVKMIEREKKYLVSDIKKEHAWDKEHVVYQWYTDITSDGHTKFKVIFDLTGARTIYVRVSKKTREDSTAAKEVKYLDISDFLPAKMIGLPFVLKRRSIKGKLFLDKMLRSSEACNYLLEDEADEIAGYQGGEFKIVKEVTNNETYYNQNMCVVFTEKDAEYLAFLLASF